MFARPLKNLRLKFYLKLIGILSEWFDVSLNWTIILAAFHGKVIFQMIDKHTWEMFLKKKYSTSFQRRHTENYK